MKNDSRRLANIDIIRRLHDQFPLGSTDDVQRGYRYAGIAVIAAVEANCEERDMWSAPGTKWDEAFEGKRLGDMISITRARLGLNP